MSSIISRRLTSLLPKHNRRFLNTSATSHPSPSSSINPNRESIISSQSLLSDQVPPPPPQEPTPSPEAEKKSSLSFLKYGLVAALTGVAATAGYASYAYTLEEVEEKTKSFRPSLNYTSNDPDSAVEKDKKFEKTLNPSNFKLVLQKFQTMAYSAAMTVPVKAIELYLDLRRVIEDQILGFTEPTSEKLLPDLHPLEQHVFTLVLDLNETLVYTDWKRERGWQTFKRPGVDAFLEHLAKFYEIVVYSDMLNMYVDPVVERLDGKQCIRYRLSRGATKYQDGKHYRDLSKLNRNPAKVIYISGHALESCLQHENCVEIKPWKLEADDTTLLDLIPFLEFVASRQPSDTRPVIASYEGKDIAKEFIRRSQEHQKRVQEQRQTRSLWRR